MASNITIPCPKCCGTGKVPLSEELNDTLLALKSLGKGTVREVFDKLGNEFIGETAVNNRLEDLRRLGFVERERQGRKCVYKAI